MKTMTIKVSDIKKILSITGQINISMDNFASILIKINCIVVLKH